MSDVNLPVVGKVGKKPLVFAVGGSAALLAFLYVQHRKNAAAASTATTGTDTGATDTSTLDPSAIDPATGVPYADEYGSGLDGGIDPNTGIPYSQELGGGFIDPNSGGVITPGTGTGNTTTPTGTQSITTNAEWAQMAESYLGTIGVNVTTLSAALGKYLTGQPLTANQRSLVEQAIASQGYPPVHGANGYPPAMHTSNPGGQKNPPGHKATRHVATGNESLDQVAHSRRTTTAHIIATTQMSDEISKPNLAKFDAYVAHGTSKKMPNGLVYYTSNK